MMATPMMHFQILSITRRSLYQEMRKHVHVRARVRARPHTHTQLKAAASVEGKMYLESTGNPTCLGIETWLRKGHQSCPPFTPQPWLVLN